MEPNGPDERPVSWLCDRRRQEIPWPIRVPTSSPVHADAADPTDYLTEVVGISPPVAGIAARILGGDSFIELTVEPGIEVTVLGYRGEPYLRFTASGEVQENEMSPTRYLNENRFGRASVPDEADARAEPQWRTIGTDGRWTWHDHRTHWMSNEPPLGLHRGDQILDESVPLLVDGGDVEVVVVSRWMSEPSPTPVLVAVVLGLVSAGRGDRCGDGDCRDGSATGSRSGRRMIRVRRRRALR